MTPSGIEPATFRFVALHLNHCATHIYVNIYTYIYIYIYIYVCVCVGGGPGTVDGIATRYGLDGPEDRIPVGTSSPAPIQIGPGATQPPMQWVPGLSGL